MARKNKRVKTRRHKIWHYRIISFLASSSNIEYIRSVPVRAFRGRYRAMQDLINIIEDLGVSREDIIEAYAHNRIMHLHKNLRFTAEFEFIGENEDGIKIYKKWRSGLNKSYKLKSYRLI